MPLSKWLSLAVGLTGATLAVALLAVVPAWAHPGSASPAWVLGVAIVVGAGVTLAHNVVVGRVRSEIHRLRTYVDQLSQSRAPAVPGEAFHSGMGLDELSASIQGCTGALRQRIEQLALQRRELEVEARIAEAERAHAEAIFNSIHDAVLVTDAFNEIVLANESAARLLGFDLRHALRRPVDRVMSDPTLVKLIKDTREGGSAARRRHVEHRMGVNGAGAVFDVTLASIAETRLRGGPTVSGGAGRAGPGGGAVCAGGAGGAGSIEGAAGAATVLGQPVPASFQETAGVVTILRDITKEKEIAEMKSEFVSNVSHELRTPLSSIKAYMEMLVDGEARDEQTRAEFYNVIQGEANRLSRLIDNILNISRIESGVVKVQREHLSLVGLIRDALEVMKPQARAKQIEIVEAPSSPVFQVFADKDMIYQAVLNLVGNAVKYTLPGGRITVWIDVDEQERMVGVSVGDTGVGVPPADLPHLFSKFFRVADHKKLAPGTGLGLNLVKHIIETVHGGRVSVRSEVGKGSVFTFSLPMADSASREGAWRP